MLYSDTLREAYYRAKETRQDAKIESIEATEHALKAIVDNPDIDVREKTVQIQYYRTSSMSKFWEAARLNKRYQEKTSQDTTIQVNHADLRAQAWDQVHNPASNPQNVPTGKEIPYKESSDKPPEDNKTGQ